MLTKRSKYVAKPVTVASPLDPNLKFRIKKVGTGEMIEHRDGNAVVRYITRDGEKGLEYCSEREFPEGTQQMEMILRCLVGWDIIDSDTGLVPDITEENIIGYVDPEEFDFLHEKCLEINPILGGVATRKRKIETPASTTSGSTDGEDDTPSVHPPVPAGSGA